LETYKLLDIINFFYFYCEDPSKKKSKCAKYWPNEENENKVFGHMQIKFVAQSKLKYDKDKIIDEVIQRSFVVSNGTSGKYVYIFKISSMYIHIIF
jgi:hypothetical protein